MRKYSISNLSFSFILIAILHSSLLGILLPYMLHEAKTSVFMSLVYSFFIGLGVIFIYFKIFDFEPDKNIFEKIEMVLPKWLAKVIEFIFATVVFLIAFVTFYRLTTFISSQFLVNTPNVIIAGVLIIPVVYSLMYDFDVMARMSTVTVFIGFLMVISNCFFLIGNMSFDNLKPILNNDFIHMSKSSLSFAFVFLIPIFSTLAIPKNNIINNGKTKKYIFVSYVVSFISVCFIVFAILSVLGIHVATLYTYPSYMTLKVLNVLNFIKNVEHLNAIIWLLYMTFSTGFYLLVVKLLYHHTFSLSLKKINILSLCFIIAPFLVVAIFALPYENYMNKYSAIYVLLGVESILLVISILVIIIGKIRKKVSYS